MSVKKKVQSVGYRMYCDMDRCNVQEDEENCSCREYYTNTKWKQNERDRQRREAVPKLEPTYQNELVLAILIAMQPKILQQITSDMVKTYFRKLRETDEKELSFEGIYAEEVAF